MTVTMINKSNGVEVLGVHVNFIKKWKDLGFEVKCYDSSKVKLFKAS